jgi:iron-sulfur cluster repair protein YtfE (RIC family)
VASRSKSTSSRPKRKSSAKGIIATAIDAVAGLFKPGSPDAVELLEKDHRTVEDLFEKVKANEDGNNAATFKKIKQELDVHAHIEETIFYPHLLDHGDKELKKIVREGIEEHLQVKDLLVELSTLSGTSPTFKAKLSVLMENVEHHVKEEEDDMFPMVRDQIDAEMLQRIGSLMYGEKVKVGKKTPPPKARKASAAARG